MTRFLVYLAQAFVIAFGVFTIGLAMATVCASVSVALTH